MLLFYKNSKYDSLSNNCIVQRYVKSFFEFQFLLFLIFVMSKSFAMVYWLGFCFAVYIINGCMGTEFSNNQHFCMHTVLTIASLGFNLIYCMPRGVLLFLFNFFVFVLHCMLLWTCHSAAGWVSFMCCHIFCLLTHPALWYYNDVFIELILSIILFECFFK